MKAQAMRITTVLILLTACLAALIACEKKDGDSDKDAYTVAASVPFPPIFVKSDGLWQITYEISISNYPNEGLDLQKVEVLKDDGSVFQTLEGADFDVCELEPDTNRSCLKPATDPPPTEEDLMFSKKLPNPYLLFWFTMDGAETPPASFSHKIYFSKPGSDDIAYTYEGAQIAVSSHEPVLIAPPLRGGLWAAAETTANTVHHRQSIISVNGVQYISQRYAVDYVGLTEQGKLYDGDQADNNNYPGYGKDIHAAADGTVIAKMDGVADNIPPNKPQDHDPNILAGNYLMTDIGNGLYILYAHMIPDSINYDAGDTVTTGDVLGKLGNSGNSDAAHLHFQICDAPKLFESWGRPYVHESFTASGQYYLYEDRSDFLEQPVEHTMEIPANCAIVTFEE